MEKRPCSRGVGVYHSQESLKVLSRRYAMHPQTVAKWKDLFADPRFPLPPTFVARALDGFLLGHRRVCIGGAAFARGPAGIAVEAVGKAIVIAIRIEQVDEPIAVSAPVRGY